MTAEDKFSVEVHRRLCAMDESQAAKDPMAALQRAARLTAIRHPIDALRFHRLARKMFLERFALVIVARK